jgi:nucleoside-diphosphate-sugar epimerase
MTSVLVTGGSGFIGSALVRRLVALGQRVRVLDDASRGRSDRLAGVEVELVRGDVRDAEVVARAAKGVDRIWHLAAVNGTEFFYTKPEVVLDVGIKGITNVIDAALRHEVGELFVASSSEVYQTPPRIPTPEDVPLSIPDPHNPRYSYAASKIASEMLALNFGRKRLRRVVVFRPHNVYGPDMGWEHVIPQLTVRIRGLLSTSGGTLRVPIQGDGSETRAFVHIDDAVDGLALVANAGEHLSIYNVGTDVETRIDALVRAIARSFGRDAEVVPGPAASGGTKRRCPDIARLRALGYRPQVSLDEGLATTVGWYDAHAHDAPAPVSA